LKDKNIQEVNFISPEKGEKMVEKDCPIENTLKLINGKWKSVIIYQISKYEPCRFSELQKLIPDCSKRMLALQLKDLEEASIIQKRVYSTVPPKTEYSLTEVGKSLVPIIRSINQWGKKYNKK
jgi:DNA-binding HxlR family transcriptional regulator